MYAIGCSVVPVRINVSFLFILALLLSCSGQSDSPQLENDSDTSSESVDGIYFQARTNGRVSIHRQDPNGNIADIVVSDSSQNWWPRVSPDKTTLLWYRSPTDSDLNNYEEAELWMANVDGSMPRKVIRQGQYGWSAQGVADWSPDGTELVMAAIDSSGFWHIYITDKEGENPVKISSRDSLMADPSWSPDGQKIVYSAYPADYSGSLLNLFALEIHIMNRDGTNEERITYDDWRDHDPYWSPDGREIVFESQHELLHCFLGKWAVRKAVIGSGEVTSLVFDDNVNGVSRWSSDSQYIYFPRTECGKHTELVRINRDGTNQTTILSIDNSDVLDGDIVD